ATVLQTLTASAPAESSGERILATAGAFLFHEDDLEKTCSVLSGGERARLRLAMLILHEHNVLLLDEPTNHLDAETVEVLSQALKDYAGTVLVVSHARTFMNALVDRICEVRNGTMRRYPGTYEEYVADLAAAAAEMTEPDAGAASPDAAEKHERAMLERDRRRKRRKIEEKLQEFEKERGDIHGYFFENPTEYAPEKQQRLSELEEEIERAEKEWLKLAE
ncbi:MAG: ATP-binding cassette domain-containing protein, partial [Patescibacteria group bacterium]